MVSRSLYSSERLQALSWLLCYWATLESSPLPLVTAMGRLRSSCNAKPLAAVGSDTEKIPPTSPCRNQEWSAPQVFPGDAGKHWVRDPSVLAPSARPRERA